MKKVIIIDGYNFLFRAFYAIRKLTRSDGLNTNALYGMTTMIIKSIEDLKPDICLVAIDSGKKTFRSDIYPDYKNNRKDPPEELQEQFEYVEPLLKSLGLQVMKKEGFEADDIIATVVSQIDKTKYKPVIVSSDKDLMQLVTPEIHMYDPTKQKDIGEQEVLEKFGVEPGRVIDVQSLMGDSSDNIPGVKSIGPKTASNLINQFGSLENLYNNLDKVDKDRIKNALINYEKEAFISKKLATLDTKVMEDISKYLQTYRIDIEKVQKYMEFMEFNTLKDRIIEKFKSKIEGITNDDLDTINKQKTSTININNYKTVDTPERLDIWIEKLYEKDYFAIDTETDNLDHKKANLVGISLATEEGDACYIPVAHDLDMLDLEDQQLPLDLVIDRLKPLLSNDKIIKVGQNIKYDMHILSKYGIEFKNVDDTMVMSFILNGLKHRHNMDELSDIYLNHKTIKFTELNIKKGESFANININEATKYAAEDADITLRLYNIFKDMLERDHNLKNVYDDIEKPLIKTLFNMEKTGVKVDMKHINKLSEEFIEKIKVLEKEIYEIAGQEFNVSSPKQLGKVLFDDLGLPGSKKTKTGWKTSQEILDFLVEQGFEIAKKIEKYRHLSKLKNTYIDGLRDSVDPSTSRVHTSYNQIGANTGRLSSSNPNLQNIPIKTEEGQKIRQCFIAEEGYNILSIDYSQVELRILAAMADIKPLISAFNKDRDIHSFTANKLFGSESSDFRRLAKIINFGIIYGMGNFSLAKQLGISSKEAKELIEEYYKMFDGLEQYMSVQRQKAMDNGYVETYNGRKIFINNANSTNKLIQSNAFRAAINAPIQGTSADVIKIAMPKIEKILKEKSPKTKMLMQIHDELVFSVKENEVEKVSTIIKDIMENITDLKVKLKTDFGVGKNLKEAH